MQITEYLNKRVFLIFLTVMLFFVSGCSKMPEGMLKTGRRAVYPGTDTPDRDNGKKPLSEYLYRAAVGSNGRFQWKYL